ncbi:MAG: hypothetical protein IT353_23600 [Gemmatimonadaceae bacterium]|nr:hypothetical protein [Gemmatimonadaceae bacterium]
MTANSDPLLRRVDPRTRTRWTFVEPQQPLATRADAHLPSQRPMSARIAARALVISAAVIFGLRIIGGWIAEPLAPTVA